MICCFVLQNYPPRASPIFCCLYQVTERYRPPHTHTHLRTSWRDPEVQRGSMVPQRVLGPPRGPHQSDGPDQMTPISTWSHLNSGVLQQVRVQDPGPAGRFSSGRSLYKNNQRSKTLTLKNPAEPEPGGFVGRWTSHLRFLEGFLCLSA